MRNMMEEQLAISRKNAALNRYAMFFVLGVGGFAVIVVAAAAVVNILFMK